MPHVGGANLIPALFLSVLQLGASHSWLVCLDYVPSTQQCRGYPRNWYKKPSSPFGQDVGRDNRPRAPPGPAMQCDQRHEVINNPVSGGYNSGAPMAKLSPGQKITLTWPAKNHAMTGEQRGVQLFISKTPNGGDDFSHVSSQAAWVSKYPELQKTFSNCVPNQSGVDKAPCSGVFTVPTDLKPGVYTFMWWWEFNPNEYYNSCADAEIVDKPPPTPAPPTPPPGPAPCIRAEDFYSSTRGTCPTTGPGGGEDCTIDHGCCPKGKRCYYKNNYYAGCLEKCPGPGYLNPEEPDHLRTPWACVDFSPKPPRRGNPRRPGDPRLCPFTRRRRGNSRRRRGSRRRSSRRRSPPGDRPSRRRSPKRRRRRNAVERRRR